LHNALSQTCGHRGAYEGQAYSVRGGWVSFGRSWHNCAEDDVWFEVVDSPSRLLMPFSVASL